ncbi:ABC transporter ATP-binding protein [Amylibacter ulvae]|uniref:ABC transporter ATP-binding protein n=1 Tax=Paramylibacter ulvae TaxID=1651968 RepID=A0ABQ3D480_9RHOB|nr:ATP-binding cassette domain-containing protein [Amylibacter ulvae]GHA52277.1 ABC transporter ATP-binding protein [Amylibacter ulvae]
MTLIVFHKTTYDADGQSLVGPLNITLDATGVTALLGHNGAGKSLFLQLAHGMLRPTDGRVEIDGQDVRETRRTRGFIFQNNVLMRRSVAQNVAFALATSNMSPSQKSERVDELLTMVQLRDRADQPAALLSGGEAQRMALARALINDPSIVMMDEPTSSMDPGATAQFEAIITAVKSAGVGFIWATHDRAQAQRCADQVIFMERGKICEDSSAEDFFRMTRSDAAKRYLNGEI